MPSTANHDAHVFLGARTLFSLSARTLFSLSARTLLSLGTLVLALAGCTPNSSVTLTHAGKTIAFCKDANIRDFFPKASEKNPMGGGYRFLCQQDGSTVSSIAVMYDTTSGPYHGTIKDISLWTQGGVEELVMANKLNEHIDCPSALAHKTGAKPFPTSLLGGPKAGTYELMMAKPCGTLVFKIE